MTIKKRIALLITVILLAGSVAVLGDEVPEDDQVQDQAQDPDKDYRQITWLSWREVRDAGRGLGKPIFLFFNAEWSAGGRTMLVDTFRDPRVIRYLEDNFACCTVDATEMTSLVRKYQVEAIPTLWFLDSSGKALTSIDGVAKPDKLLRVLKYIWTEAYLTTKYNDWLIDEESR